MSSAVIVTTATVMHAIHDNVLARKKARTSETAATPVFIQSPCPLVQCSVIPSYCATHECAPEVTLSVVLGFEVARKK